MGQEVWLLLWYCVTIANPACMKRDGTTEMLVTSFKSGGSAPLMRKRSHVRSTRHCILTLNIWDEV